jgi:hypothetical protein
VLACVTDVGGRGGHDSTQSAITTRLGSADYEIANVESADVGVYAEANPSDQLK